MRIAELVTSSILILLGLAVLSDALRLGIGWGTDGPNSGFFPFWLAVVMIVACAIIMVQTLRQSERGAFVKREQLSLVLQVLIPAVALVVLTHWIGLYVAAAFYIGFYMRWAGHHPWALVVALSIFIPLIAFYTFEIWFLVPMPKGPVEAWLGY